MTEKTRQKIAFDPVIVVSCLLIIVGLILIGVVFCQPIKKPAPVTGLNDSPAISTSVMIEAAPQVYSPFMSSTPGIAITPNVTGFNREDAQYQLHATYGQFLDWDRSTYLINQQGSSAVSDGKKVYWSFLEFPESTPPPVIVTMTAKDKQTGRVLGTSRMTLTWEQNNTFVRVQKIE